MPCQNCGAPASLVIDSVLALAVWNTLHPDDRRTELHYCSHRCTYDHGVQQGKLWLDLKAKG